MGRLRRAPADSADRASDYLNCPAVAFLPVVGYFRHQKDRYCGDFNHTVGLLSRTVRGLTLGQLVTKSLAESVGAK